MQWQSVGDFFSMGGAAAFVWGSYGVCALLIAVELFALTHQRRQVRVTLRRWRIAMGKPVGESVGHQGADNEGT